MLQQILKDMYIDPELLAELSEHQKELLYVKMREEQVRRYKNREEEEKKTPPKKVPKKGNKKVVWLQGRDGCEWVWVMGHHKNDRTIEQILERENKEKARLLAEKEAQEKSDEMPETTPGKTPVCNQESTDTMKKQELKMKGKEKEGEERQKKLKEEEERLKKEEEKLERERKKAEAEAYASMKELRQQQAKMAKEEAEKKKKDQELKEKKEQLKREREQKQKEQREQEVQLRKDEEARREELYMSLKQIREEQKKASMKERDQADKIFQVQLRESKRADKDRSHRAKIAREEVRRSRIMSKDLTNLTIQEELIVSDKRIVPPEKPLEEEKPSLPLRKRQAPRPPKPTGHKSVVEWFQKEECERQAGLLKDTKEIAPWFHGIITRQQAEYLLFPKAEGHFLVRVSERIWGYALSFRDKERAKHFLIDASGSMYSFFGQDQKDHASLEDLVQFHMRMPISEMGKEILKTPCVQAAKPPDYEELFSNQDNHNTVL